MQFKYLEHTADIKFKAFGKTKEELIINSGKALCNSIIDLKEIEKKGKGIIEIKAKSFEQLLFKFLQELLFEIDANELIFSEFQIKKLTEKKIELKNNEKKKEFSLIVFCLGEKINLNKHEIKTEIKAITKHEFKIEKKEQWTAEVLVDV